MLFVFERRAHQLARGGGAANELYHNVYVGVGYHIVKIGGEQMPQPVCLRSFFLARANAHYLQVNAIETFEIFSVICQNIQATATHGAGAY